MTEKGLRFAGHVVYREEPDGAILFNIDNGDVRIVEGVAWGICNLIDRGTSRSGILRELVERYPEQEHLEEELDLFLGSLRGAGLLES